MHQQGDRRRKYEICIEPWAVSCTVRLIARRRQKSFPSLLLTAERSRYKLASRSAYARELIRVLIREKHIRGFTRDLVYMCVCVCVTAVIGDTTSNCINSENSAREAVLYCCDLQEKPIFMFIQDYDS